MITKKITPKMALAGGVKLAKQKLFGGKFFLNLEVTKHCSARCDFCDYWKTKNETRITDYLPIVKKFNPMYINITGGEPLLRKDLPQIVKSIKDNMSFIYIQMITHGQLMTEEKGVQLWEAGLDQITFSLDFPDERHDKSRGIPGLFQHITSVIPKLKARGIDNIGFNTFIMKDNMDSITTIVELAKSLGVVCSFSSYFEGKANNPGHSIGEENMPKLDRLIEDLIRLKRVSKNIRNSDFYLRNIPVYFRQRVSGCQAGVKWLQITPDGHMKRCSEFPVEAHWTEYTPDTFKPTDCTACWFSCRGEAEAPMTVSRILELNR